MIHKGSKPILFKTNMIAKGPKRYNLKEPYEIRNSSGLCTMAKPGEVGMIVGKVRNDVLSKFEGYTR